MWKKPVKPSMLIGEVIKQIYMVEKDKLEFHTQSGKVISWYVEGDCCSVSWIEHIEGIRNLREKVVFECDLASEQYKEEKTDHNLLQFYRQDIKTGAGTCSIEFRNDSNGYYCGWIDEKEGPLRHETFESLFYKGDF